MKQGKSEPLSREFEKLSVTFYLMVGVPLLLFAWIYLNLQTIIPVPYFEEKYPGLVLHLAILAPALYLVVTALKKYKARISDGLNMREVVSKEREIKEKANIFLRTSRSLYWSLTFSNVLIIAGFYFSAQEFYIIGYSILLILFSINRPVPERMVKELRLKKEEKLLLFELLRRPE